jgi:uncharacterized membrane protein
MSGAMSLLLYVLVGLASFVAGWRLRAVRDARRAAAQPEAPGAEQETKP